MKVGGDDSHRLLAHGALVRVSRRLVVVRVGNEARAGAEDGKGLNLKVRGVGANVTLVERNHAVVLLVDIKVLDLAVGGREGGENRQGATGNSFSDWGARHGHSKKRRAPAADEIVKGTGAEGKLLQIAWLNAGLLVLNNNVGAVAGGRAGVSALRLFVEMGCDNADGAAYRQTRPASEARYTQRCRALQYTDTKGETRFARRSRRKLRTSMFGLGDARAGAR